MLGLFGTLDLGARSLQAQRQGVEIAGQNLANVNNTAYARQRVEIQTSFAVDTGIGPQGTGANAVAIRQIRDAFVDSQINSETSVGGYLDVQERYLQYAQAALGEQIDGQTSTTDTTGTTDTSGLGNGLANDLSNLFQSFQGLSTSPTSIAQRQALLGAAQNLSTRFHQVDQGLAQLDTALDQSVSTDVSQANQLLSDIAHLNDQVSSAEFSGGTANDLRDLRQQKIEALSQLVNVDAVADANGGVNISIGGNLLVSRSTVLDTLQTYPDANSHLLVRTATGGTPLVLTSGSIQGAIDTRDGAVATLRGNLNSLASTLISEVNNLHGAGYSLTGSTGAVLFTGTDAATIGVNSMLVTNPQLLQAAGVPGATGDAKVALALAQLADKKLPGLNNQTLSQGYSQTVADLGQSLADVKSRQSDQSVLKSALLKQRDSVSGVSIDEEMTDLVKYQKAFEASAHLITVVDSMLDTVLNLKG